MIISVTVRSSFIKAVNIKCLISVIQVTQITYSNWFSVKKLLITG